jgi:hypothetical protein
VLRKQLLISERTKIYFGTDLLGELFDFFSVVPRFVRTDGIPKIEKGELTN